MQEILDEQNTQHLNKEKINTELSFCHKLHYGSAQHRIQMPLTALSRSPPTPASGASNLSGPEEKRSKPSKLANCVL